WLVQRFFDNRLSDDHLIAWACTWTFHRFLEENLDRDVERQSRWKWCISCDIQCRWDIAKDHHCIVYSRCLLLNPRILRNNLYIHPGRQAKTANKIVNERYCRTAFHGN